MKIPVVLLITLLCGINFTGMPLQDRQVVLERVRRYIEEKEPTWKFDRKEDLNDGQVFYWKSDKQRATVSIVIFSSEDEAKAHLSKQVIKVPVGWKSKINNLGDEAFLYQSAGSKSCMLLIRKETVYIQVNADECADAEKFARHTIKSIDK
jgi:hypothetical protein